MLANAGLPMIIPQILLMGVAFVPVVLLEGAIMRGELLLPWRRLLKGVTIANLGTTLVGIPLAWVVMLGGQFISSTIFYPDLDQASPAQMLLVAIYESAWLWPHMEHLFWLAPLASMVLLVPSFVISFVLERKLLAKLWADTAIPKITSSVLRANVWSYLGLFIFWNLWILVEVYFNNGTE